MRKYKTVVIDLKKIIHRAGLLATAMLLVFVGSYISGISKGFTREYGKILGESLTVVGVEREPILDSIKKIGNKVLKHTIGFLPFDNESIIKGSIPVIEVIADSGLIAAAEAFEDRLIVAESGLNSAVEGNNDIKDIPKENIAPIKCIDASQKVVSGGLVAIGNETSYGIDIDEMLASTPDIDMTKNGPKILITHTHATESYAPSGATVYDVTASDRSEDKNKNVVSVGRKMKEVFEEYGIETIHDEILHDVPSFNGSYAHSLKSIEEYTEKYPSIQVVFDIHRDSIVYDDKTKAKTMAVVDGKEVAQLMFVVGTDENGLYNPEWRSNMRAALHFQSAIVKKYPKLMRHINLRKERFNGHTSGASMIIEVGTSGNSLEEALSAIELAAGAIAEYLTSM